MKTTDLRSVLKSESDREDRGGGGGHRKEILPQRAQSLKEEIRIGLRSHVVSIVGPND